jgi:site-specific recombinase XerC
LESELLVDGSSRRLERVQYVLDAHLLQTLGLDAAPAEVQKGLAARPVNLQVHRSGGTGSLLLAVISERPHLQGVAKRKPSTTNTSLAAIADFYIRRGLGQPDVRRLELPRSAPRALTPREATRWLRAVQHRLRPRDRLLALLPFYAGLRIGEAVALDVDDVRLSARKGLLIVRSGKGERYCELPVHAELHENLAIWLDERPDWPAAAINPALFLNHRGGRLTIRGARDILVARGDSRAGRRGRFGHDLRR